MFKTIVLTTLLILPLAACSGHTGRTFNMAYVDVDGTVKIKELFIPETPSAPASTGSIADSCFHANINC